MNRIRNILLVDDDPIQEFLLRNLIGYLPHKPVLHFCMSGHAALDFLAEAASSTFPDLILVDLSMPSMDGFSFVETYEPLYLEARPGTRLIILTSSIAPPDQRRASTYTSIYRFISKPILRQAFIELVTEVEQLAS